MSYFVDSNVVTLQEGAGTVSRAVLKEENGCVNGFKIGIGIYAETTYDPAKAHEDQEGFIVLSGKGWALVGDEEAPLEPGTVFVAPKHTLHTIKSASKEVPVKVCWFHAAV